MNDALATLAWLLLVAGWAARRNRRVHVPLVLAGIALDLALVGYLEFSRHVIEKTVSEQFSAMRWAHIATSTIAVVLYIPTLILGFRLLRGGDFVVRRRHAAVAVTALAMRTVGFICMWAVETGR